MENFFILLPVLSFLGTFSLLLWLLKGDRAKFAMDHPNQRSLHTMPIPRVGGLGLMLGAMIGFVRQWDGLFWVAAICAAFLMLVSLMDDIFGLSVKWRLLAHGMAAAFFLGVAVDVHWGLAEMVALFVATVWMINLYNFMDGADGLAGGMALMGFGFYGVAAYFHGSYALCLVSASIAASALAFLLFNFHPAKVFMGDAGSIPLGFLAAALGIIGWQHEVWPAWFPLVVFSPFIVDASVTLLRRLARGEKVWQAHSEHFYQHLVQSGWGHRRTALAEYVLMAAAGASATWAISQDGRTQLAFGIGWGLAYLLAMWLVDAQWSHKQRESRC